MMRMNKNNNAQSTTKTKRNFFSGYLANLLDNASNHFIGNILKNSFIAKSYNNSNDCEHRLLLVKKYYREFEGRRSLFNSAYGTCPSRLISHRNKIKKYEKDIKDY